MGLSVVGAGFGRTGTSSLKLALERLGFGPCHHMSEVRTPVQKAIWRAAGKGDLPDWDCAYSGYGSAIDWPTAHFWKEVSDYYPHAKVILTVRDPDSWYHSMQQTLIPMMMPTNNDPESFGVAVIGQRLFGGRSNDRDYAVSVMEAHNKTVMSTIAPERLLRYDVSRGWEPLCAFLEVPTPSEPFPKINSTAEFRKMTGLADRQ